MKLPSTNYYLFRRSIKVEIIVIINPMINTVRNITKNWASGLLNISFSSAIFCSAASSFSGGVDSFIFSI